MKSNRLINLLFGLTCAIGSAAESRQWRDNTGGFSVEAEFLKMDRSTVFLRKTENGSIIKVPIERLTDVEKRKLKESLPEGCSFYF